MKRDGPRTGFRLRSVVSVPYRGGHGALQDRDPHPPRPAADIAAAVRGIPDCHVRTVGQSLMMLSQGEKGTLSVQLALSDRIGLGDLVLSGRNDDLALSVAYALVPLFGPMELRIGDYAELVDGSEPVTSLVARHNADLLGRVQELSQTFESLAEVMAPFRPDSQDVKKARAARARKDVRQVRALMAVAIALLGGTWFFGEWLPRAPVAAACAKNGDCRSKECLPRESTPRMSFGGVTLPGPLPTDRAGVCTAECKTDKDCPFSMRCGQVEMRTSFGGVPLDVTPGEEVWRCVPSSWTAASSSTSNVNPSKAQRFQRDQDLPLP